jgi:hypothetical protein
VSSDVGPEGAGRSLAGLARTSGTILALSYPVLALSTGARAGYRLWEALPALNGSGGLHWLLLERAPAMSAVAALCYLTATVGFAVRRRWAWIVSVAVLSFETAMTLIVGTLSVIRPEVVGHTVWRLFGIDYGFFPLFQPLLGLLWLFWPVTLRAYGIESRQAVRLWQSLERYVNRRHT